MTSRSLQFTKALTLLPISLLTTWCRRDMAYPVDKTNPGHGFGDTVQRMTRFMQVCAVVLLGSCSAAPPQAPTPPDPVTAIARSLALVHGATQEHPRVLKILFYGQSISTPKWTDQAMAALRAKYPYVAFDYRNLALGGWSAKLLARAAARDVADFYPDLVVFHVYGDNKSYEQIIRIIRSETAADVIVQTDHVTEPVEPLCASGFHLRWTPLPGCVGHLWFRQRHWEDFMSGLWIPTMARKYDLALEPRRQEWSSYLQAHHLAPMTLIHDRPHPNAQGWTVMANLFTAWFEQQVDRAANIRVRDADRVRTYPSPAPGAPVRYHFIGNRMELLAAGPLDGKVKVRIDGKTPQDFDGCWQNSRVSHLPNVVDWPALKQVDIDPGFHQADRWTFRVTGLDDAQDKFAFTLADQLHGPDGSGTASVPFTSADNRVRIDPQDWNMALARQTSGTAIAEGSSFTVDRRFGCTDQPAVLLANGRREQRHVVATRLANRAHDVELIVAPDAPTIFEVRTYRPALGTSTS